VQPMQLDGDGSGFTPFTATCVPGAISIMTPAPSAGSRTEMVNLTDRSGRHG